MKYFSRSTQMHTCMLNILYIKIKKHEEHEHNVHIPCLYIQDLFVYDAVISEGSSTFMACKSVANMYHKVDLGPHHVCSKWHRSKNNIIYDRMTSFVFSGELSL